MNNFLFSLWKAWVYLLVCWFWCLSPISLTHVIAFYCEPWSEVTRWGLNDFIQLLNIFIASVHHLMMLPVWFHFKVFVCHSSLKNHSWKTDYYQSKIVLSSWEALKRGADLSIFPVARFNFYSSYRTFKNCMQRTLTHPFVLFSP